MEQQAYHYLVKYTAEVGTKGSKTRWNFIRKIARNIDKALQRYYEKEKYQETRVTPYWSSIQVTTPTDVRSVLAKIAGVQHFAPSTIVPFYDFDTLVETAGELFRDKVKAVPTFGVRCRLKEQTDYSRKDVEREVGSQLIDEGEVDLDNPGVWCFIEIREGKAFLYTEKVPGIKGMPVGIQGKTLTLLSGGIDSPVAAWLSYRVGFDQDFVYFDLGGQEQKDNIFRVYQQLANDWGAGADSRLFVIDFLPVIREIRNAKKPYQNLVLKYFFYKTAEQLADHKVKGIVTGEAVGQVSTQTLPNLQALDQVTSLLVLRPLLTYTKEEITALAREIDTFDIAYTGKEFCALATENVVTASSHQRLMEVVDRLDTSVMEEVVADREVYALSDKGTWVHLSEDTATGETQQPASEQPGETDGQDQDVDQLRQSADRVIDLRDPDNFQKDGWPAAENIPFDRAWKDFTHWDKDQSYLLVCEVGSQSQLLAHYMEKEGFTVHHVKGGIQRVANRSEP